MSNTLYLECNTGISGDMMVAALLDLGVEESVLRMALESLNLSGYQIQISRVKKSGLDVCDFDVKLDEVHENHDHDMSYLYGHLDEKQHENYEEDVHGYSHGHSHVHEETIRGHYEEPQQEHHHEEGMHEYHCENEECMHEYHQHGNEVHMYEHQHGNEKYVHAHHHENEEQMHEHQHENEEGDREHMHGHHHAHRGLKEITEIIENSSITDRAKEIALRIFHVIAAAEAKAHGESTDTVHFHEVGAVDSIVDIVAVAVCLDALDVTEVIVPYLCEGTGSVRCQHGILPVPVPAVANIVAEHQIALRFTNQVGELVTPTGAAIIAAIRTSECLPEVMKIQKIGLGAGKRKYERPSILRAMLIEEQSAEEESYGFSCCNGKRESQMETIYRLETDIDDSTGEQLGFAMEQLMEAGAKDVHFQPIYMKKNRPAYELIVICEEKDISAMETILFRETTTIGVRRMKVERTTLERKQDIVSTKFGDVEVKVCTLSDGSVRIYPEYESVAKLAKEKDIAFQDVVNILK